MSIWTHAAGVIRIDNIRGLGNGEPDFDELVGKECLWESPAEVWDDLENNPDDYLPCGSEGTLQKSVWINPDKHETSAYTVTIFGDLRDYEAAEMLVNWFKKKCKEINDKFIARNAIITAVSETGNIVSWTYKPRYAVKEKYSSDYRG